MFFFFLSFFFSSYKGVDFLSKGNARMKVGGCVSFDAKDEARYSGERCVDFEGKIENFAETDASLPSEVG